MDELTFLVVLQVITLVGVVGVAVIAGIRALRTETRRATVEQSEAKCRLMELQVEDLNRKLREEKQRQWALDDLNKLRRGLEEAELATTRAHARFEHEWQAMESETGFGKFRHILNIGHLGPFSRGKAVALVDLFPKASVGIKWHILAALDEIEMSGSVEEWPVQLDTDSPLVRTVTEHALEDHDLSIRSYAAFLTMKHRMKSAVPKLRQLLTSDRSPSVVTYCELAIGEIDPEASAYSPKVDKLLPVIGYILVKAPEVTERFYQLERYYNREREPKILEACVVEGPYDLLVKIAAVSKLEFDSLVMAVLQSFPWVEYTRTYQTVSMPGYLHWFRQMEKSSLERMTTSWVFASVPTPQSGGVVTCATEVPGVTEACAVLGDFDVVLRIVAEDETARMATINLIRRIPYARDTVTLREFKADRPVHLIGQEAQQLQISGWHHDYLK